MNFNNNKIKTGMILAAGLGTRLRPLTLTTPKPLIEINGKALIDYTIEHLLDVGIKTIIVNTHYLAEQVEKHLQNNFNLKIITLNEEKLLDTGGAILNAMKTIANEPFLVINSDIFLEKHNQTPVFAELIEHWNPEKMDALLLLKDCKKIDYSYHGDFNLDGSGKIIRSALTLNKLIHMGAYIVSPAFFGNLDIHPFSTINILFKSDDTNFDKYKFYGLEYHGKWFDIGNIERLNKLEKYLKLKYETSSDH